MKLIYNINLYFKFSLNNMSFINIHSNENENNYILIKYIIK